MTTIQVGDCILHQDTMYLSRGPEQVKLSAKVYGLLMLFLEQDNHIVSREDAIEKVWNANEAVGKRGFTNAIWMLRRSFKELGVEQDVFKTLPKLGYQLNLRIEETKTESGQPKTTTSSVSTEQKIWRYVSLVGVAIISVLLLLNLLQRPAIKEVAPTSSTARLQESKVTHFEGIEEMPAVSNSGNYLAFQWIREGFKPSIYIKDLNDQSSPLNLVALENAEEASPAWSFNDEYLAYIRVTETGQCQLRIRQLLTSRDTLLHSDCYYQPYKTVVTWSNSNTEEVIFSKPINGNVALFKLHIGNDTLTQMTFPSANEVHFAPHLSADDETLIYIREKGSSRVADLVMQTSDSANELLLENKVSIVDFDWDLEQQKLFISLADDSLFNLVSLTIDQRVQQVLINHGLPSNLSFNPKTQKLVYTEHISKEYLAQIALSDGQILRRISSSSRDMYGRFNPANDEILFLSNRSALWSLWSNNKINSKNLTESLGNALVPAISPNGQSYAVTVRQSQPESHQLYVGDFNSHELIAADTQGLLADNLSWSLDGKSLYFYSNNQGKEGIYKLDVQTHSMEKVTEDGEIYVLEYQPGQLLYTKVNQSGLWLLDLQSGKRELFTDELAEYDYGAFFIQGDAVFYVYRDKTSDQIRKIQHGKTETLIHYPANSVRKFFGISAANEQSLLATLKVTNEADIKSVELTTNQ